jgi:hypothetical protein
VNPSSQGASNGATARQWTDLSFLDMQLPDSKNSKVCRMYEAQISVALCGINNGCWTGYAFANIACDEKDADDEIEQPGGVKEDPIISSSSDPFDANRPIWDPREYFLMALKFWITRVLEEYAYLVRVLERSVESYVRCRVLYSCAPPLTVSLATAALWQLLTTAWERRGHG